VGHDVPDNHRAVIGAGNGLGVVSVHVDLVNTAAVFLQRALHDLGLAGNTPHTDLTLLATGDDSLAVMGGLQSSDTVVVGIVNSVEELS
jgi:hypothetical protein